MAMIIQGEGTSRYLPTIDDLRLNTEALLDPL